MKRIVCLFILAVFTLSLVLPVSVYSAEMTEGSLGGDTYWKFDEATGELTVYGTGATGDFNELIIKDEKPFVTARPGFFHLESEIKKVIVQEGITVLGISLFSDLPNVTSILLPDTLVEIDNWVFARCYSLTTVSLPNSLTRIGESAFRECTGLTSINWPPNVTYIEGIVFEKCTGLTEFSIPNTVTKIGSRFLDGSGVKTITIPKTTFVETGAFIGYAGEEIIFEEGTTHISGFIYGNNNLKKIIIPQSVTSIDYQFWGDNGPDDLQICYTGTQKQLDDLFESLYPDEYWVVKTFKSKEIITDYVSESIFAKDTTDEKTDKTFNVETTEKEELLDTKIPETKIDTDGQKSGSIFAQNKTVIVIVACVFIIIAAIAIIVIVSKKRLR